MMGKSWMARQELDIGLKLDSRPELGGGWELNGRRRMVIRARQRVGAGC